MNTQSTAPTGPIRLADLFPSAASACTIAMCSISISGCGSALRSWSCDSRQASASNQRHRPGVVIVKPRGIRIGRGAHPDVLAGAELNARGALLAVAFEAAERRSECIELASAEATRQNDGVLHG